MLTGLKGLDARKFMAYCNFKDEDIVKITDYKLFQSIMMKFDDYKKSKKDSLNIE